LNKLESPLPKDDSYQIAMHSGQWFMRRFIKIFLILPLILSPKSGQPLYLNKSESPSPKHDSYQVWLKLTQWFLRRSRLKGKLTDDDDATAGELKMPLMSLNTATILNIENKRFPCYNNYAEIHSDFYEDILYITEQFSSNGCNRCWFIGSVARNTQQRS